LLNKDFGAAGASDPYYVVSLSEDGGKTKTKIGKSDSIQNDLNPDWTTVFEITFDRHKNQVS